MRLLRRMGRPGPQKGRYVVAAADEEAAMGRGVGVGRQGVNVLRFFLKSCGLGGEQRQGFGVYMHESRLAARSVMLGGRVGPQTRLLRQYVRGVVTELFCILCVRSCSGHVK